MIRRCICVLLQLWSESLFRLLVVWFVFVITQSVCVGAVGIGFGFGVGLCLTSLFFGLVVVLEGDCCVLFVNLCWCRWTAVSIVSVAGGWFGVLYRFGSGRCQM